jgi:hypothetical protein
MDADVMRSQITLADGRVLDAWIDSDAGGVPFVFHFGTPSSGISLIVDQFGAILDEMLGR